MCILGTGFVGGQAGMTMNGSFLCASFTVNFIQTGFSLKVKDSTFDSVI